MARPASMNERDPEEEAFWEQLKNAEKKMRELMDAREQMHELARAMANERDTLHASRKEISDKFRALLGQKDAANAEMRAHRDRRDEYQKTAKGLLDAKKKQRGNFMDIGGDVNILKVQINELETQYQTQPMTLVKEREHLDKLRAKNNELQELLKKETVMDGISGEIRSLDERIDQLFKMADMEHAEVQRLQGEVRRINMELDPMHKEMDHLSQQAQRKHDEFVKAKERANSMHERVVEMRTKVMSLRGERNAKEREEQAIIDNQNQAARAVLDDDSKLDSAADEAIALLKTKGKLSFK